MSEDQFDTFMRALLGNRVQMMNALATILHDTKREEFAEMVLQQATLSQNLCDSLDRISQQAHRCVVQ